MNERSSAQVKSRTKSRTRALSTRSVLYVGYPCNLKCQFCYYAHNPERRWRTLEATCRDATTFRRRYGHDRVDITGGEPSVYPHILGLIAHCAEIGLRPSLITNTQVLADRDVAQRFKDHGIYDFLCSVHAIGDQYNEIVCRKSGWSRVEQAIDNLNALEIPWRANCTLTRNVVPQLEDVVAFTAERGCRVLNFISFNSFYEWEHSTDPMVKFQARHSEIRDALHAALAACDRYGLEANVRYMPLCFLKGHEEKGYNFPQMPYDSHEWGFDTWCFSERGLFSRRTRLFWEYGVGTALRCAGCVLGRARVTRLWAEKNRRALYRKGEVCKRCSVAGICDGLTRQYAGRFGFDELEPFDGPRVTDPLHFISRQDKLVD